MNKYEISFHDPSDNPITIEADRYAFNCKSGSYVFRKNIEGARISTSTKVFEIAQITIKSIKLLDS